MEYKDLLERARSKLPESVKTSERFEIPKVRGHIQGNKTIISNFFQIATALRRRPEHILKFILRELATPGDIRKNAVLIGAKIPASRINEKIYQYARLYVLCPECGKPDTQLSKEKDSTFIKCLACGARSGVQSKI